MPVIVLAAAHAQLLDRDVGGSNGQALAYLGKEAKAAAPLALTTQAGSGDHVAYADKGEPLSVLLVDKDGHYLVQTAFGLVGWAQAAAADAPATQDQFGTLHSVEGQENGEPSGIVVHYNPDYFQVINDNIPVDGGPTVYRLLRGKIGADSAQYVVECDWGMSGDPSCSFNANGQDGAMLGGDTFYVPGNGYIYSASAANAYYPMRTKWALRGNDAQEIKQPYYAVGIHSEALADLAVQGLDGKAFTIATGGKVDVILHAPEQASCAKEEYCPELPLLVRNAEGESGWTVLDLSNGGTRTAIKDIIFLGD